MDKKLLLKKLEKLFFMEEVTKGFKSREDCLGWTNKVAPLLKFNEQYYANFVEFSHRLNLDLSGTGLQQAFRICINQAGMAIEELKLKLEQEEGGNLKLQEGSMDYWQEIEKQYGVSKKQFSLKIFFVEDNFRRDIIFRDVNDAHGCLQNGFYKPAVILAGGIIEELLRLYLNYKKITIPKDKDQFDGYIKLCVQENLLKTNVSNLSHSFRGFRNLVHLRAEVGKRYTISRATALGAISALFTIVNDFEK